MAESDFETQTSTETSPFNNHPDFSPKIDEPLIPEGSPMNEDAQVDA